MLKGIGLFLGFVVLMFIGSHFYQGLKDHAAAAQMHASTTDMLIDELNQTRRLQKPWPPKRGYYEDIARWRDSISQVVVREVPDDPMALCNAEVKAKVVGRMNEYFDRKLTTIRYPLHAAGESEARSAEVSWLTSVAEEAEGKIAAVLRSGQISVRDVRRTYFGEARRLLGEETPPQPVCPT